MTPLVSVIIPTYNRAADLRRALASVSGQTWNHAEVVTADNNSTDDTRDVVEGFRRLDDLNVNSRAASVTRFASVLLLGVMATVIVFNDYQISDYTGLMLLALVYRTLQLHKTARLAAERAALHVAASDSVTDLNS